MMKLVYVCDLCAFQFDEGAGKGFVYSGPAEEKDELIQVFAEVSLNDASVHLCFRCVNSLRNFVKKLDGVVKEK